MFRRFRQHGVGIVASLLVAAAAFPAAAMTSSPPGSSATNATHPATDNGNLDSELLASAHRVYAEYVAKVTELRDRIAADTKELRALEDRRDGIVRSHRGSWPPTVQEQVDAIDMKIAELQARAIRDADGIKAANVLLNSYYEVITNAMKQLNGMAQTMARGIAR
jgi:hypothetical protein